MLARIRTRGRQGALQPSLPSRDFGRVLTSFLNLRDCPLEDLETSDNATPEGAEPFCPGKEDRGEERRQRVSTQLRTRPRPALGSPLTHRAPAGQLPGAGAAGAGPGAVRESSGAATAGEA